MRQIVAVYPGISTITMMIQGVYKLVPEPPKQPASAHSALWESISIQPKTVIPAEALT